MKSSTFVLTLLLVSLAHFSNARPETFIVQGDIAKPGQFPWHALIHVHRPNHHIQYCGGSLISPNFILTAAAHIDQAKVVQVFLGSTLFNEATVKLESRQFFIHPQYNAAQNVFDVALIQLPQNVQYSFNILPVRLPTRSHQMSSFENVDTLVSGFGVTQSGSVFLSNELRFAHQRVISAQQCSQTYSPGMIGPSVLCAACATGRRQSACNGDTGGALVFNDNGKWTQIGLVSFYPKEGCDLGLPIGYTKITQALDWISSTAALPIWP